MIYFIGNKQYDWVKIGVCINLKSRLSGIQIGCPVPLIIFHTEEGGQSVEKKLHEYFRLSHIRGEWFRLSGPIQDYIDKGIKIPRYQRHIKMNKVIDNQTINLTYLKKRLLDKLDNNVSIE